MNSRRDQSISNIVSIHPKLVRLILHPSSSVSRKNALPSHPSKELREDLKRDLPLVAWYWSVGSFDMRRGSESFLEE